MNSDLNHKIQTSSVYNIAKKTPLTFAKSVSKLYHHPVYLKREDLQDIFSFKIRGAFNKISSLDASQLDKGLIAASAGNHAQGVALSAAKLGARAVIVMPVTTPSIKIDAVRELGAEVVLSGDTFDQAKLEADRLVDLEGYILIHPYDDLEVIAGQGTVGLEIINQLPEKPEAIFVPVGGGGLLAGVASIVKSLSPKTKIIAVEAHDSASFNLAYRCGKPSKLDNVGLFADGTAVKEVGQKTFEIAKDLVDSAITVSNDQISAAIKEIFYETRTIAEPAGALAMAGLRQYLDQGFGIDPSAPMVAILSGANISFGRLNYITERTETGSNKEILCIVEIPEQPGSFKEFIGIIGQHPITEFSYRYADPETANIFVGVGIGSQDVHQEVIKQLSSSGKRVVDLTNSDLAKDHLRYLIGGKSVNALPESVYKIVFPERPGALMNFLDTLGDSWNISLFHYRNHFAAFGKVLIGFQINPDQISLLEARLDKIGYQYQSVSDDPGFRALF